MSNFYFLQYRIGMLFFGLSLAAAQVNISQLLLDVEQISSDYTMSDLEKAKRLKKILTTELSIALYEKPDYLTQFSRFSDAVWNIARHAELTRPVDEDGYDIPYIAHLQKFFLPVCDRIKNFETIADDIITQRNLDEESASYLKDRLLISLSKVGNIRFLLQLFLFNSYEYFSFEQKLKAELYALNKNLFKKQAISLLKALMPCRDFIAEVLKQKNYSEFNSELRTMSEYIFFIEDREILDELRALLEGTSSQLHAITFRSYLEWHNLAVDQQYPPYHNPLILELIRFNLNFPDKTVASWRAQRTLIKEQLKKFTSSSFPWFYKKIWHDTGYEDQINILSWLIRNNDTDLFDSLPLIPGAAILSEPLERRVFKTGGTSDLDSGSLYSVAPSPEWVKKLRALGAKGDISAARAAAVPVSLEDLAFGLALLKY